MCEVEVNCSTEDTYITIPEDGRVSNLIRWGEYRDSEELYNKYHNLTETPKCIYCSAPAKYKSFHKGYMKHCNTEKCKKEVHRESLKKRAATIKAKTTNLSGYDDFIRSNLEYYKCNEFPFTDIFDGTILKSMKRVIAKSESNLDCFNDTKTCIVCGDSYEFNTLKHDMKCCSKANCKRSVTTFAKRVDVSSIADLLEFAWGHNYNLSQIYTILKSNKVNLCVIEVINILKLHGYDTTLEILKNKCIILNENVPVFRASSHQRYSLLYNKIMVEGMTRVCSHCGDEYVYQDVKVSDDGAVDYERIGAEHSCSAECYHKVRHKYKRSECSNKKQSETMKLKILKNEFTPCVTNSWAKSRCYVGNIPFRSTWEAYFYLHHSANGVMLNYEKKRIRYFDTSSNTYRVYIIDFVDEEQRILYEIKPICNSEDQLVKDKERAALQWCADNNYDFIFVTDTWFYSNCNYNLINNVEHEHSRDKMMRNLKQFKKE